MYRILHNTINNKNSFKEIAFDLTIKNISYISHIRKVF